MSRAYICDRCGKIMPDLADGNAMKAIWITNPYMYPAVEREGIAIVHLCDQCYADFGLEYLANLQENR